MNTKTTVVLALLVVIGGVLLLIERPWEDAAQRNSDQAAVDAGRPQPVIDKGDLAAEDVQRVELLVADQPSIVVERDGTEWKLTAPIQTMAEKWLPDNVIRRCLDLRYTRKFAPGDEGAPTSQEAGLDDPQVTVILHRKDDQPSMTFHFGSQAPLSTNYYAAVNDAPDIYVVTTDVRRTFVRSPEEFRSKKIFNFNADDVTSVAVAGVREYELKRDPDNEWIIDKPVRSRANKAKAASLVSALRNLRAKDFADDNPADLTPYGLDAPSWTIALTIEKTIEPEKPAEETEPAEEHTGEQPATEEDEPPETIAAPQVERSEYALLIGGPAGDNRYAKLADQPWVFTIPETTLTSLTPELLDLRDKTLCDFKRDDVEKIDILVARRSDSLTRKDDHWILDNGERAEPIAVDDLLKTMEGLKAVSFEDQPPLIDTGLDSPRALITLTVTGRLEPLRLAVGNPTASGKMTYARSDEGPSIAVLRDETVAPLLTPPIGYRDRQILDFNKSLASAIDVTRQGQTFSLVESHGNWLMTAPIEARADTASVTNILADLNNLRAKRVVAAGSGSEFGLDDPWVRASITVRPPESTAPETKEPAAESESEESVAEPNASSENAEPEPTATQPEESAAESEPEEPATEPNASAENAEPGPEEAPQVYTVLLAATPDGKIYARREEGQLVYEVDHTVLDNLLAELHDRKAIPVDRQTYPAKISYRTSDRAFTLEKVGKDKWIADVDSVLPIDPKKIDSALDELRNLRTGKFVNYRADNLAAYGLDSPAIEVTVVDEWGEPATIMVSATGPDRDPDQSRYATVAGTHEVYLLPLQDLGVLNKTLSDFEKTE
jgi:hypothetical protein